MTVFQGAYINDGTIDHLGLPTLIPYKGFENILLQCWFNGKKIDLKPGGMIYARRDEYDKTKVNLLSSAEGGKPAVLCETHAKLWTDGEYECFILGEPEPMPEPDLEPS